MLLTVLGVAQMALYHTGTRLLPPGKAGKCLFRLELSEAAQERHNFLLGPSA